MRKLRQIQTNRCYHLMNRMAHRAFYLTPDERSRAVDLMRRAEAFSGVQVLSYVFLSDHFHIYAYIPDPQTISDDEILQRIKTLYRGTSLNLMLGEWDQLSKEEALHKDAPTQDGLVTRFSEFKEKFLRRMWSSSEFMRTFKQHFTMSYNGRHKHDGTMWESRYVERHHKPINPDMLKTSAYIDANAVKAGLATSAEDYEWCSFSAACQGDPKARQGYAFIYHASVDDWEAIRRQHEQAIKESLQGAGIQTDIEADKGANDKSREKTTSVSEPHSIKDPGLEIPEEISVTLERGDVRVAMKILELLDQGPQTSKELREALGLRNSTYLNEFYLKPLLAQGRIVRTKPNSPRSPAQKYAKA